MMASLDFESDYDTFMNMSVNDLFGEIEKAMLELVAGAHEDQFNQRLREMNQMTADTLKSFYYNVGADVALLAINSICFFLLYHQEMTLIRIIFLMKAATSQGHLAFSPGQMREKQIMTYRKWIGFLG